jgi:hypothetical protein
MKKSTQIVLSAVLAFSLGIVISACSSGGGSSSSSPATGTQPPPAPTITAPKSLATTTEGAQAASAGVNVAQGATSSGGMLSGLVALGAPKLKIPFASTSVNKAVANFTAKIKPLAAKAQTLRSTLLSAATTTTITQPCTNAGFMTITMDTMTPNNMTFAFNSCQENTDLINGTMILTGATTAGSSSTMQIGTDAAPFTDKTCTDSGCTQFSDVTTAAITMSFTTTVTTSTTDVMTLNGWMQFVDNTVSPATTDREDMSNFSITNAMSTGVTASTVGGGTSSSFDVDTLTLNGSASTTHLETNNDFGEADTFKDLQVKYETDYLTTAYYSIDGLFAIALNPADKCIDGTFNFVTITPMTVDLATGGNTVAGEFTVNNPGGADVVFNSNGTVTVTVNGVTQDYSNFDSLCAF